MAPQARLLCPSIRGMDDEHTPASPTCPGGWKFRGGSQYILAVRMCAITLEFGGIRTCSVTSSYVALHLLSELPISLILSDRPKEYLLPTNFSYLGHEHRPHNHMVPIHDFSFNWFEIMQLCLFCKAQPLSGGRRVGPMFLYHSSLPHAARQLP
jgi:hypothetical protein